MSGFHWIYEEMRKWKMQHSKAIFTCYFLKLTVLFLYFKDVQFDMLVGLDSTGVYPLSEHQIHQVLLFGWLATKWRPRPPLYYSCMLWCLTWQQSHIAGLELVWNRSYVSCNHCTCSSQFLSDSEPCNEHLNQEEYIHVRITDQYRRVAQVSKGNTVLPLFYNISWGMVWVAIKEGWLPVWGAFISRSISVFENYASILYSFPILTLFLN